MTKVKNPEIFAGSEERQLAGKLVEAALAAIDTREAISRQRDFLAKLPVGGKLVVVGVGKCALAAAETLEELLGERVSGGLVIDLKPESESKLKRIKYRQGDHPFPTARNAAGAAELLAAVSGLAEADIVLAIISGGGSTLLCRDWELEVRAMGELFAAGAPIQDINLLRKHLAPARGGGLSCAAYPARVAALIFSDVPGNDLGTISSGPTVLDQSTAAEAWQLAERYELGTKCGLKMEQLVEAPKDPKFFAKTTNELIVSNRLALEAMKQAALAAGWQAEIVSDDLTGEAAPTGERLGRELAGQAPHSARLWGGETTVKVVGQGEGGRNQEVVLGALPILAERRLLISLASDGHDNGQYAGAIADQLTQEKATAKKLDGGQFLSDNNASRFFEATGDVIITGKTGANVSDLIITIHG